MNGVICFFPKFIMSFAFSSKERTTDTGRCYTSILEYCPVFVFLALCFCFFLLWVFVHNRLPLSEILHLSEIQECLSGSLKMSPEPPLTVNYLIILWEGLKCVFPAKGTIAMLQMWATWTKIGFGESNQKCHLMLTRGLRQEVFVPSHINAVRFAAWHSRLLTVQFFWTSVCPRAERRSSVRKPNPWRKRRKNFTFDATELNVQEENYCSELLLLLLSLGKPSQWPACLDLSWLEE